MTSCKLYSSDHYYGTGESFLFTFYPKFKIFKVFPYYYLLTHLIRFLFMNNSGLARITFLLKVALNI